MNLNIKQKLILLSVLLLFIDQAVKIWIKTHYVLGKGFNVIGDWFQILFTENNGMAWGLASNEGVAVKISLTLFRIVAVCGIGWYINNLMKRGIRQGVLVSLVLIFCGAMGNILDSIFYGVLFNDSLYQVATFFPEGGGYAPLLQGKVVDMLYFPLFRGTFPAWFPFWSGENFEFFRPIFNLADSYITIGVILLILFYRDHFSDKSKVSENQ